MDRKKNRKEKGGGVGILIAKNIEIHVVEDISGEDHKRLAIKWINLQCRPKT